MSETVSININGKDCVAPRGVNVIEACAMAGVEVPHFCYHPELSLSGSCRMCLVSIGTPVRDRATGQIVLDAQGGAKIGFMPKPAIACGTTVSEGMHILTNSPEIKRAREGVMEFILANHPLDCPICDQAGECKLQEYAQAFGNGQTRFVENKNAKPKRQKIACGKITLDAERCILCSRCVRYSKEKLGREIFGFTKRGSHTEISVENPGDCGDNYIVNAVDLCPVGALTESAFRFKMRTWFLRAANSISADSSAGVNTKIWSREGKIYRITPRENKFVNESWMPDSSRLEHEFMGTGECLLDMRVDGVPCTGSYALARAAEILNSQKLAIVASAGQTLEEHFVLAELAQLTNAEVYSVSHIGDDDGRLLSADKTPNMRGLFVSGLLSEYPKPDLWGLAQKARAAEIKNILCFEENLLDLGFDEKDFKLANVVYCGVKDNSTAKLARVAIALESNFEKEGLFINRQFRLQKFDKVLNASDNVLNALDVLVQLINSLRQTSYSAPDIKRVRLAMGEKCALLPKACDIGYDGALIDSSPFSRIKFPEETALNFKKNES